MQEVFNDIQKKRNSIPVSTYEESHEAVNRDSCIFVARNFASLSSNEEKNFVFLSASDTIGPLLEKYS